MEDIAKRAFEANDVAKKGYIMQAQFMRIMRQVCRVFEWPADFTAEEKKAWFEGVDQNSNGQICLSEFQGLMVYILQAVQANFERQQGGQ
mmetsp:Transcript_100494/g.139696  ORF Transcript_100494/g.139696 Transcript_100494/m.139696 type:complete len:90 (+) Transcript_100494:150-419(+)